MRRFVGRGEIIYGIAVLYLSDYVTFFFHFCASSNLWYYYKQTTHTFIFIFPTNNLLSILNDCIFFSFLPLVGWI